MAEQVISVVGSSGTTLEVIGDGTMEPISTGDPTDQEFVGEVVGFRWRISNRTIILGDPDIPTWTSSTPKDWTEIRFAPTARFQASELQIHVV